MPQFIINKNAQSNGDHEVHNLTSGSRCLPKPENQVNLGIYSSCIEAIIFAKRKYPTLKIDGCYHCCKECHTS